MKKILLPIDYSEISKNSFPVAKEFAENLGSELVIVSVIETSRYSPTYNLGYADKPEEREQDKEFLEKETSEMLEKAKLYFDGSDIKVSTKVLWGSPGDAILDYSEDENFDLIIMNTQGMAASKRFVIGSVANNISHHAKIPVMVVR